MSEFTTSIFSHQHFSSFLREYVKTKKSVRRGYSYKTLARLAGSVSPSLLVRIGLGRRLPTPRLVGRLRKPLGLSSQEFDYALAMVELQRADNLDQRRFFREKMERLKPYHPTVLNLQDWSQLFGNWRVLAILEMISLKDFRPDSLWISKRLGYSISPEEVSRSLDKLRKLGLVKVDFEGKFHNMANFCSTPKDVPICSVRQFDKDMLKIALEAVDTQSPAERYIAGTTLSIRLRDLERVKAMIRQFRAELVRELQCNAVPGDEVYHFAVQFFRLTKSERKFTLSRTAHA